MSGRLSRRRLIGVAAAAALMGGRAAAREPADHRRIMSEPSPAVRSATLEVGGQAIHTLISTPEPPHGAPTVVLVHGLALSGQYMVPTIEALAPHYPVLVPDLPGFGDSAKPARALDVAGLADALAAWMTAAGLDRAILLGNSFGCQIIGELAARHPPLVQAAVLQGPTAPPEERTWLRQFIRWRQNEPNNTPGMAEISAIDYRKCGYVRALATFDLSLRHRLEDRLPALAAPALVVRGTKDPICRQDWAERVARELPQGDLALNPERHEYELYLAVEDIDHSRTKTKSPQTNGIVERFHKTVLDEFYRVAFRKRVYASVADLQANLDAWIMSYNEEREHQGRWCFGKTPMRTFLDAAPIAREKMIAA